MHLSLAVFGRAGQSILVATLREVADLGEIGNRRKLWEFKRSEQPQKFTNSNEFVVFPARESNILQIPSPAIPLRALSPLSCDVAAEHDFWF